MRRLNPWDYYADGRPIPSPTMYYTARGLARARRGLELFVAMRHALSLGSLALLLVVAVLAR